MKEFKLGQTVKVVDNGISHGFYLKSIVGTVFIVKEITQDGYAVYYDSKNCDTWFILPEACELVSDIPSNESDSIFKEVYVIKHKDGHYVEIDMELDYSDVVVLFEKEDAQSVLNINKRNGYNVSIKRWKIIEEDVE
jgi:hypothetical protein